MLPTIPTSVLVTGVPIEEPFCVGGVQLVRRTVDGVISWLLPSGAAIVPLAADILTASAGNCAASTVTVGAAVAGILNTIVNGSVPAGKQSISFTNIGTSTATVGGQNLPAGATVSWEAYLDPVANQYKRLPIIIYAANATSRLLISWVD